MRKKLLCLLSALILSTFAVSPALAYNTPPIEENAPVLINSEIRTINGIRTLVEQYKQYDSNITAYTILDKSLSQSKMNETIEVIRSASRFAHACANGLASVQSAELPDAIATREFYDEDPNTTDIRASVSQHGIFNKSNQDLAYLWLTDMYTEVGFNDPFINPEIYLQRTVECTGVSVGLSVSVPPGISVGVSNKTYQLPLLGPLTGKNFLKIDWPSSYYASSVAGSGFSLKAISDVSFYAAEEGHSYAGYVSSTQDFQWGW